MIDFSKNLRLPDAILAQHMAVLGKTRSGKSSVLRLFVESLLDRKQRVCVLDPKGDWWGLKSSADGKRAGYEVVIFGGPKGDLPLNQHAGAQVAELVTGGNRPCVIDLGGWMVGERTRFFIDFASTLFRTIDAPLHLVVDEVHNFAPQGKILDPDAGKMLHWANRLASEGAGKGLTILSASQRPQKVHKDFLTCAETLVAMRVIHQLDRNATKEWIDGAGDPAHGREVLSTLASMGRGEGWVWSPEAKFGPQRVKFPLFRTYDSFAAPVAGESKRSLRGWAEVNIDAEKAKLIAIVAEAKANDPKELRKQIAELQKQLKTGKSDPNAIAAAEAKGEKAGRAAAEAELRQLRALVVEREGRLSKVAPLAAKIGEMAHLNGEAMAHRAAPTPAPVRPAAGVSSAIVPTVPKLRSPGTSPQPATSISKAQQRILDSLAWWGSIDVAQPSRGQAAFVAGYTVNGHFNNLCGALRGDGLIDYPLGDHLCLTAEGAAAANFPEEAPSLNELHARIRGKLSSAEQKLFDAAVFARAEGEDPLTADLLASRSGYTINGHFNNLRGRLHSLGLVEYLPGGRTQASDLVFPPALTNLQRM